MRFGTPAGARLPKGRRTAYPRQESRASDVLSPVSPDSCVNGGREPQPRDGGDRAVAVVRRHGQLQLDRAVPGELETERLDVQRQPAGLSALAAHALGEHERGQGTVSRLPDGPHAGTDPQLSPGCRTVGHMHHHRDVAGAPRRRPLRRPVPTGAQAAAPGARSLCARRAHRPRAGSPLSCPARLRRDRRRQDSGMPSPSRSGSRQGRPGPASSGHSSFVIQHAISVWILIDDRAAAGP